MNQQFYRWWCFSFYWFGKPELCKFTNGILVIGGAARPPICVQTHMWDLQEQLQWNFWWKHLKVLAVSYCWKHFFWYFFSFSICTWHTILSKQNICSLNKYSYMLVCKLNAYIYAFKYKPHIHIHKYRRNKHEHAYIYIPYIYIYIYLYNIYIIFIIFIIYMHICT